MPLPSLPTIHIPQLQGELQIDGRLEEAVWQSALVIDDFALFDGERPDTDEPVSLRLWYDKNALYLGWDCVDFDIQATMLERDSHLWEEDVVEMFLTKDDLSQYFELEWSPLGAVFDATITNRIGEDGWSKSFKGEWGWTATGMTFAARKESATEAGGKDKGWAVEVRIPFSDLGAPTPEPGEQWRGNFFRINRYSDDRDDELWAWSPPLKGSFHQPSRFGHIIFAGPPQP